MSSHRTIPALAVEVGDSLDLEDLALSNAADGDSLVVECELSTVIERIHWEEEGTVTFYFHNVHGTLTVNVERLIDVIAP